MAIRGDVILSRIDPGAFSSGFGQGYTIGGDVANAIQSYRQKKSFDAYKSALEKSLSEQTGSANPETVKNVMLQQNPLAYKHFYGEPTKLQATPKGVFNPITGAMTPYGNAPGNQAIVDTDVAKRLMFVQNEKNPRLKQQYFSQVKEYASKKGIDTSFWGDKPDNSVINTLSKAAIGDIKSIKEIELKTRQQMLDEQKLAWEQNAEARSAAKENKNISPILQKYRIPGQNLTTPAINDINSGTAAVGSLYQQIKNLEAQVDKGNYGLKVKGADKRRYEANVLQLATSLNNSMFYNAGVLSPGELENMKALTSDLTGSTLQTPEEAKAILGSLKNWVRSKYQSSLSAYGVSPEADNEIFDKWYRTMEQGPKPEASAQKPLSFEEFTSGGNTADTGAAWEYVE